MTEPTPPQEAQPEPQPGGETATASAPDPAAVEQPAAPSSGAAPPADASSRPTDPISAAVAPGYVFEGPALELGGLMLNATDLSDVHIRIPLGMLNRHGLVAGATGTGKTKTLQLMAEQLSSNGVPVFAADIKGDLSGISVAGAGGDKIVARAKSVGQDWTATAFPSEFYALGGQGTGI
ncbi:MAG: helicase HerA-like domain-containing protein, partial [Marmoricola sp.]